VGRKGHVYFNILFVVLALLIFLAICLFLSSQDPKDFLCLSYHPTFAVYLVNKQCYKGISTVQESTQQEIGDQNKIVFQEDLPEKNRSN
jgi:hypothetical protein